MIAKPNRISYSTAPFLLSSSLSLSLFLSLMLLLSFAQLRVSSWVLHKMRAPMLLDAFWLKYTHARTHGASWMLCFWTKKENPKNNNYIKNECYSCHSPAVSLIHRKKKLSQTFPVFSLRLSVFSLSIFVCVNKNLKLNAYFYLLIIGVVVLCFPSPPSSSLSLSMSLFTETCS